MGMFDFLSSWKKKAQDVTMDKVLERMRDLKMPVKSRAVDKLLATHVLTLPGISSAKVDISREGLALKISFSDGRPTIRRALKFVSLLWEPHKRSFVFEPAEPFDYLKDHATYACVATTLAAVMQTMLGFKEEQIKEHNFSTEIGPVTGVIEKDGKLYYDIRRIPLLRQYAHFRVMGQAPIEHVNITDCWCESGKIFLRFDMNRMVDQIKSQLGSGQLDIATLRKMLKGDYSHLTEDEDDKDDKK